MDESKAQDAPSENRSEPPAVTFPSAGEQTAISSNKMEEYSKYLVGALKAFEDRLPVAGALIVIVGYVVIAAFGEIDSFWKYLAYISILCFGYLFFAFKKSRFSLREKVLLGVVAGLVIYIAFAQGLFVRLGEFLAQKK